MIRNVPHFACLCIALLSIVAFGATSCFGQGEEQQTPTITRQLEFSTHDELPMTGKLTLSKDMPARAVVVYVQTAEGMTIDMKRPKGGGETFNYFDLYREKLPPLGVAFFSYEGRGISMGDDPPRYEAIDQEVYNTSTLDNKVQDVIAAVRATKAHAELANSPVILIGTSEGSLLAAEAATRMPGEVDALVLYGVMSANMSEIFTYILTDGAFLAYTGFFDTDKDGKITQAEFEADARGYRARAMGNAPFNAVDRDGDGLLTVEDQKVLAKPLLDAIEQENFTILNAWAKNAAGVSTPDDWFKDHFAHPPIGKFLDQLDISIGLFHGDKDINTPIAGVKALEERAKEADQSNLEFHYFEGLDHSLGIAAYFFNGKLPAGHEAIFEFIDRQAGEK